MERMLIGMVILLAVRRVFSQVVAEFIHSGEWMIEIAGGVGLIFKIP